MYLPVVSSKFFKNSSRFSPGKLLNTGRGLPAEETAKVVDGYASKLLRSGHTKGKVKEIIVAGLRGYERKLKRCLKEGRYSGQGRRA